MRRGDRMLGLHVLFALIYIYELKGSVSALTSLFQGFFFTSSGDLLNVLQVWLTQSS